MYSVLKWTVSDEGVYATLYATVASIGAVFIGLYYTAVTTIAASTFAKTPSSVRGLISREQIGNVYIRFLSYLTALSIFLLTFRLLNYEAVLISIPIVAGMSCFGIIAFVKLGQRVFSFFDPIQLSNHIYRQFEESLTLATSNNANAFDPSFQNYAQTRARSALNSISDLINICKSEKHLQKNSLTDLGNLAFNLLTRYQDIKHKIPPSSLWFQQDTKFVKIYRQSDYEIQMAHQTANYGSTNTESNHWWVESFVFEQLFQVLDFNLDTENTQGLESFVRYLERVLGDISRSGEAAKSILIYSQILNISIPHFSKIKDKRLKLILSECLARIPVVILLKFLNYSDELTSIDWKTSLAKIAWEDKRAIYKIGAPQHLLHTLLDLSNRMNFEIDIEGKVVTPVWYLQEIVFRELAENLAKNFAEIYNPVKGKIGKLLTTINEKDDPIQAALIVSVFNEFLNKLKTHQKSFEESYSKLTLQKNIVGLHWPTLACEPATLAIKDMSQLIALNTASLSECLSLQDFDETLPDFAGRFLHETGENIFEAILHNDSELFVELFEKYFIACIFMFEGLKPDNTIPEFRLSNEVRVALGPIADLITLSGYALLFSELTQTEIYKNIVHKVWDTHLKKETTTSETLQNIVRIAIQMGLNITNEPHRGMLRMEWSRRVQLHTRRKFNIKDNQFEFSFEKYSIPHESALIRVFAQPRIINEFTGLHVFDALYFSKLFPSDNSDFSYQNNLLDEIDKENKK